MAQAGSETIGRPVEADADLLRQASSRSLAQASMTG
jgi:hypothetical protein